jgi:ankyrin repeat protein
MRAEACIQLGKWEEASKLLDEEFEGKSKLLRSLSSEFIRQGKRTEAERVLRRDFDGRETVLISLVTLYLQDRKWSDAQRCQLDLMKYETEPTIRLERTHFLAEICFKVKDYERAKEYCLKAIQGRQQIFGKRHHLFYQSVNLLAQILDATGDIVEAEAYKAQLALLPPGLHGTIPSHSILTAECVEIEQLCHLDAKQAAEEIGKTFFKALLADKKERNSVKENILKGSSLVSSTRGWSLIHTLAAYGRELAVQLLLEKGADLEAPSDHGTPLVVAALYGYEGTVKLLLEKGAQLEARNKYGGTPLSVATMNGYEGIVKLLIDRGANIEGKDKKGNTPLMCAARQDNWRIVEFLLWKGADAEARNKDGSTALMIVNNVHSSRATSVADLAGVSKTPTVALLQEAMSRKKNPWRVIARVDSS